MEEVKPKEVQPEFLSPDLNERIRQLEKMEKELSMDLVINQILEGDAK